MDLYLKIVSNYKGLPEEAAQSLSYPYNIDLIGFGSTKAT